MLSRTAILLCASSLLASSVSAYGIDARAVSQIHAARSVAEDVDVVTPLDDYRRRQAEPTQAVQDAVATPLNSYRRDDESADPVEQAASVVTPLSSYRRDEQSADADESPDVLIPLDSFRRDDAASDEDVVIPLDNFRRRDDAAAYEDVVIPLDDFRRRDEQTSEETDDVFVPLNDYKRDEKPAEDKRPFPKANYERDTVEEAESVATPNSSY